MRLEIDWRRSGMRGLCAWLSVLLLQGCVVQGHVGNSSNEPFDATALQMHCNFYGCDDPGVIAARYFARLSVEAGGACIAHVPNSDSVRPFRASWEKYLHEVVSAMPNAQIHLFGLHPATSSADETVETSAQWAFDEVQRFYLVHFPPTHLKVTHLADAAALGRPYQTVDEVCQRGPVLEVVARTAQIVSRYAAPRRHVDRGHAIIAVIDISASADNHVVWADDDQ